MSNLLRLRLLPAATVASLVLGMTSVGPASVSARTNASCDPAVSFDPGGFSDSTHVDNTWYPLVPGTQFVFDGYADRGGGVLPHRIIFTVTNLTKLIDGVQTVVLFDRDLDDGQLVEAELAFQAQDSVGNVWSLGEYPEEYEDGAFIGAPSTWMSGQADAEAGILMLADPALGSSYYLQGRAPAIDFLDCAKVFKTGEVACVPSTCYENVLVTDERSPLDPGSGSQRKHHAPAVGVVQVTAVGDKEGETLALVGVEHLSRRALTQVREEVLKLEKHAYRVSDVYRQTAPMTGG